MDFNGVADGGGFRSPLENDQFCPSGRHEAFKRIGNTPSALWSCARHIAEFRKVIFILGQEVEQLIGQIIHHSSVGFPSSGTI